MRYLKQHNLPTSLCLLCCVLWLKTLGFWGFHTGFCLERLVRFRGRRRGGDVAHQNWKDPTNLALQTTIFYWLFQFSIFIPIWGKWSNLTNIFQGGWNHQLDHFLLVVSVGWWTKSLHKEMVGNHQTSTFNKNGPGCLEFQKFIKHGMAWNTNLNLKVLQTHKTARPNPSKYVPTCFSSFRLCANIGIIILLDLVPERQPVLNGWKWWFSMIFTHFSMGEWFGKHHPT